MSILSGFSGMMEGAASTASENVKGAVASTLPLNGTLWTWDKGFRFTPAGQIILGAAAAYGIIRFLGR